MRSLLNSISIKTKFIMVLVLIITAATTLVVAVRVIQVRDQQHAMIVERLQGNANLAIGIFRTVRHYTEGILDVVATLPYVQEALSLDAETVYDGLKENLSSLFYGMNHTEDGVLVYANIFLFDANLNVVVKARPEGTDIDIAEEAYAENVRAAMNGETYTSPVARNPVTGRMQFLFTQPVMANGEFLGIAAVLSNTEVLSYFLREPTHDYDSFINIADIEGTIFFSNRRAYIGRHVDDLGVYEAFGYVPTNTMFYHTSAITGIEKIAYITVEPELNWTIISFFDAHAVDNIAMVIIFSLVPTISGILAASALMLVIVSRSLAPLKPLAAAAKHVAGGNLDVKFDIRKNDEIAQVSKAFLEIVRTLKTLLDNFSKAERSMTRGETHLLFEDIRLGGVYDEMFTSTNNIVKHMQTSQVEAERANKAKSDFLATMSHEIRTPMNAILGIAQIQMQNENLPSDYSAALMKIYNSGNNLLGIINDILDMSKIETGKMELTIIEYDVPSLINDAVQLNVVRIGSREIEFILEVDEDLPSKLRGDELRLKQVLNNLLSNGIKYTEKGYVKLSVSHTMQDGEVELHMSVEDTGQGMKLEDRDKFFSEYQRFNSDANRTTEGTGLGLSITKNLVEMMDGNIWVESEYGKGSIFMINVKQGVVDSPPIGPELAERLRNFTFTGERQMARIQILRTPMPYGKVLIVDDVETNLYVAEGLMAPYQLKIETAISGFAAIDLVNKKNTYDVIFMDHMMPQMDGIETTHKLRGLGYTGVIVALTANALVGNDEMFMKEGFDGFIPKPIDIRQLNAVLNKFIRDRRPEEAKKYGAGEVKGQAGPPQVSPKMLQIFRRDAEKAVAALLETSANGDLKLFTTTAHAMKSALANVNEPEASKTAAELENAGIKGDSGYIAANTAGFIKTLEELIERLRSEEPDGSEAAAVEEDTAYLAEELGVIKAACEDYDAKTAYAAFDRIKEKQWNAKTAAFVEEIRDLLYLDSDFDKVAEMIDSRD